MGFFGLFSKENNIPKINVLNVKYIQNHLDKEKTNLLNGFFSNIDDIEIESVDINTEKSLYRIASRISKGKFTLRSIIILFKEDNPFITIDLKRKDILEKYFNDKYLIDNNIGIFFDYSSESPMFSKEEIEILFNKLENIKGKIGFNELELIIDDEDTPERISLYNLVDRKNPLIDLSTIITNILLIVNNHLQHIFNEEYNKVREEKINKIESLVYGSNNYLNSEKAELLEEIKNKTEEILSIKEFIDNESIKNIKKLRERNSYS